MGVRLKRAYDDPAPADGTRILVDRLWPRGLSKARARIDDWMKDIAPSDELRRWFGHDPSRWDEFKRRYRAALAEKPDLVQALRARCEGSVVTLVFAARDESRNNAVVLKEVLTGRASQ